MLLRYELLQIFEEDLEEISSNGRELSIEERKAIVDSLRGIAATEGKTPPTDEEIKEDYTESFTINALQLYPREELDFDNIGKLIEETEGDFHK